MSNYSSSEGQNKIMETTLMMIEWLKSNTSDAPDSFDLGYGERVVNSKKCISTIILSLENYLDKKKFGYAFMAEYNLAYRIKTVLQTLKK